MALSIALMAAKVTTISKTSKNVLQPELLGWIECAIISDLYAKSHITLEGYDLVVMLGHWTEPNDA